MRRNHGHEGRCLREQVPDYVAGLLDATEVRRCERHLITCELCRAEVAGERALQATLRRDDPVVPGDLRTLLLSVGSGPPRGPMTRPDGRSRGSDHVDGGSRAPGPAAFAHPSRIHTLTRAVGAADVMTAPRQRPASPIPVLSPAAPACHRSALRSALLATAAAGASVAAAWSIGVGVTSAASPVPVGADSPSGSGSATRTPPPAGESDESGAVGLAGTLIVWTGGGVTPAVTPTPTTADVVVGDTPDDTLGSAPTAPKSVGAQMAHELAGSAQPSPLLHEAPARAFLRGIAAQ